ncbi:hypothetical protein RBG61_08185 [Paludicola sp. MB14-C6]|nr:hypothetical protein [Paludicola sp. MB14-C6]WMJ21977.1 hypothetical protein RBG61_08185 [Paludicola sp. MB14-C6]
MINRKLWISVGIILVIAIIVIGIIMACFTTRSFEQVYQDCNLI